MALLLGLSAPVVLLATPQQWAPEHFKAETRVASILKSNRIVLDEWFVRDEWDAIVTDTPVVSDEWSNSPGTQTAPPPTPWVTDEPAVADEAYIEL